MKNVVGYVRISSASQIDNTSIEVQIEKIQMYCSLHNLNLVKIYKDEGISAKNTDRPNYQDMMEFLSSKESNVDGIVVYKNDRLHRSLYDLLGMIKLLKEFDVDLVSITEMFDTSTAQGMLFLQMLGSFSEFERQLIVERTKSGRLAKGEKKLYPGGKIAFGYNLVDEHLTINYEEAEIVKDIFKMRCKGITYTKIAQKHSMSKQRVSYILKNRVYLGKYKYEGKVEKNKISFDVPRIITSYTFTKANKIES